jgi:selenide, water dikinase
VLAELLTKLPPQARFPNLLVGVETSDDAAVYRISDSQAVVATTDFFLPIVDDPYDFGRIAAANALSDVYAVGGAPILALALAGMPINKLSTEAIGRIFEGGAAICAEAGVPVAGGHTIDAAEPLYGLAAIGLIDPARIKRNSDGRAGDTLILGKGLGIGILGAAINQDAIDDAGYAEMIASTIKLNSIGAELAAHDGVHAMTDVTGNGLCGHVLEVCRGSRLGAEIAWDKLPLLPNAVRFAEQGFVTGASARNWTSYEGFIAAPARLAPWQRTMLMDPQTSGGLLVSCDPAAASDILHMFHERGYGYAAQIGRLVSGDAKVVVT